MRAKKAPSVWRGLFHMYGLCFGSFGGRRIYRYDGGRRNYGYLGGRRNYGHTIFVVAALAHELAAAFALGVLGIVAADFAMTVAAGSFGMVAFSLVAPHFSALDAGNVAVGEFAGIGAAAGFAEVFNFFQACGVAFVIEAIAVYAVMFLFIANEVAGNAAGADHVFFVLFMAFDAAVQGSAANQANIGIGEIVVEGLFFIIPAGMGFAAAGTFTAVGAPFVDMGSCGGHRNCSGFCGGRNGNSGCFGSSGCRLLGSFYNNFCCFGSSSFNIGLFCDGDYGNADDQSHNDRKQSDKLLHLIFLQ